MRHLPPLLILTVALVASGCAHSDPHTEPGGTPAPLGEGEHARLEREVDACLAEWGRAVKEKDLDAIVALYSRDADLVYDDDTEIRGEAAIRRHFQERFLEAPKGKEQFTNVRRKFLGHDLVIESACWELIDHPDPRKPKRGRYSATLQKIGGSWKIIHDRAWSTDGKHSARWDVGVPSSTASDFEAFINFNEGWWGGTVASVIGESNALDTSKSATYYWHSWASDDRTLLHNDSIGPRGPSQATWRHDPVTGVIRGSAVSSDGAVNQYVVHLEGGRWMRRTQQTARDGSVRNFRSIVTASSDGGTITVVINRMDDDRIVNTQTNVWKRLPK